MTIESFANDVIDVLQERFPHIFGTAQFEIQTVSKPGNITLTGIIIKLNGPIAPVYYVNSAVENGTSAMEMAADIAKRISDDMAIPQIDTEFITTWSQASQYIVPRLIDSRPGRNVDYLKERVKANLCTGIAVIYDIILPGENEDGTSMSVPVTRGLMNNWEVNPQQIHDNAIMNGQRIRPLKLASLSSILAKMMDLPFEPGFDDAPTFDILTNQDSQFGAAVILYPGVNSILAEKYPQGCYLLPSSIHEWIIIDKAECIGVNQLLNMVMEINTNEVQPQDLMADDVFELDHNGKLVSVIEGGRH